MTFRQTLNKMQDFIFGFKMKKKMKSGNHRLLSILFDIKCGWSAQATYESFEFTEIICAKTRLVFEM